MTIRDQIRYSLIDLFPLSGTSKVEATGDNKIPAEEDGDEETQESWLGALVSTLGRWFYSLALIASIAVPVLAICLIWSLRVSMVNWNRDQLMRDRDSRRLTMKRPVENHERHDLLSKASGSNGNHSEKMAGAFDEAEENYVKNKLAGDSGFDFAFKSVFGSRTSTLTFDKAGHFSDETSVSPRVVSIRPGDPVLDELEWVWRTPSTGASNVDQTGAGEVMLHESIALQLGIKIDGTSTKPQTIEIFYWPRLKVWPDDKDEELVKKYDSPPGRLVTEQLLVTGVFRGSLLPQEGGKPEAHAIMSHRLLSLIAENAWKPSDYYLTALWGPISGSAQVPELLSQLRAVCARFGVSASVTMEGGLPHLLLERSLQAGPLKKADWMHAHGIGGNVVRTLEDTGILPKPEKRTAVAAPFAGSSGPGFSFLSPVPLVASVEPIELDSIRVEVNQLSQLVKLRDLVVDKLGLDLEPTDHQRVKSARRVMDQNENWSTIQSAIAYVTGFLALMSLVLALSQRIRQKTSEVGILRAFGATPWLIGFILLWQSVILWAIAATICALTVPLLYALSRPGFIKMTDTRGEAVAAQVSDTFMSQVASFPWLYFLATAGGALGLVTLATMGASWVATSIQPAHALKVR